MPTRGWLSSWIDTDSKRTVKVRNRRQPPVWEDNMRVLVVGSMAYDSVETYTGSVDRALGGSATFFSIASSLFAPTAIVAVVGEDFAASDLERLARRDIDLSGVQQVPGETFRWGGRYSRFFETRESLFTELNVFSEFSPQIPAPLAASEVVFLANIHPDLQGAVLDQVDSPAIVAMDTMNFWIDGAREALKKILARVDLLFLNDEEAFSLAECGDVLTAARRIQAMGPATVVLKRGEHGAWLFSGEDAWLTPALPLDDVVDPTGAGDSFAGGFMGYVARAGRFDPATLQQAMIAGTLVASCCCQGFSVDRLEAIKLSDLAERRARLASILGPTDAEL